MENPFNEEPLGNEGTNPYCIRVHVDSFVVEHSKGHGPVTDAAVVAAVVNLKKNIQFCIPLIHLRHRSGHLTVVLYKREKSGLTTEGGEGSGK